MVPSRVKLTGLYQYKKVLKLEIKKGNRKMTNYANLLAIESRNTSSNTFHWDVFLQWIKYLKRTKGLTNSTLHSQTKQIE